MKIEGLWIPLITPLYHGKFDEQSVKKLIETTQEFIDGYVVGLRAVKAKNYLTRCGMRQFLVSFL